MRHEANRDSRACTEGHVQDNKESGQVHGLGHLILSGQVHGLGHKLSGMVHRLGHHLFTDQDTLFYQDTLTLIITTHPDFSEQVSDHVES